MLQVAGVVQYSYYIDQVFAATAVDQEMPRSSDGSGPVADPIAAEEQMIGPDAVPQFRPLS